MLKFAGAQNHIRGEISAGGEFVVGPGETANLVPLNSSAHALAQDFTIRTGGKIEVGVLTIWKLTNAGVLKAVSEANLTIRSPTQNAGGTLCSNGNEVILWGQFSGGTLRDFRDCSSDTAHTDSSTPGVADSGKFIADSADRRDQQCNH